MNKNILILVVTFIFVFINLDLILASCELNYDSETKFNREILNDLYAGEYNGNGLNISIQLGNDCTLSDTQKMLDEIGTGSGGGFKIILIDKYGNFIVNVNIGAFNGLLDKSTINKIIRASESNINDSINPEAIINYDSNSKTIIVSTDSNDNTLTKTERCLDKKCSKKIENYFLIDDNGNKLSVSFKHDKSNMQDSFNLQSLEYSDKKIKSEDKFSIIDSKRKITSQFSNKTLSVVLDFDKKTNKTKIQIKDGKKKNSSVKNGEYNIVVNADNGRLSYQINKFSFNNDSESKNSSPIEREFEIFLESRNFVPSKGIDNITKEKIKISSDKIHIIIQLYQIPNEEEKQELENKGIKLLSYIPNRAWFASIYTNKIDEISELPDIRAISGILPDDKISSSIRTNGLNNYSISEKGEARLIVRVFQDSSLGELSSNIIKKYGGKIKNIDYKTLEITLPKNKMYQLAKEDSVKWIDQFYPATIDE